MDAIVVPTKQAADDLMARLDTALGYPKNNTEHATEAFAHYGAGDQPWAVVVDEDCTAAAAPWTDVPAPQTLTSDWWPPRGG